MKGVGDKLSFSMSMRGGNEVISKKLQNEWLNGEISLEKLVSNVITLSEFSRIEQAYWTS